MSRRSHDDSTDLDRSPSEASSGSTGDATTDVLVESGPAGTVVEDSGEEALSRLGLEARAELDRLRARLGLLGGDDEQEEPAEATQVGRYRLLERIGHGGMGVVYRAHDPQLGRAVAIKLVQASAFAAPKKLRVRLLREARVLAKLAHPNVVRVYDCGEHQGEVYLAMEHVAGKTLREWQDAERRAPAAIVEAYVAAAMGLGAAHDVGIVHRDFKPDNVLVADDGRILVGDFGLAVGGDDEGATAGDGAGAGAAALPATMTKTGALLGTVLYMAPEQLRGDPATAQSDQFAFCVALWEAFAGARPFEGEDSAVLLAAIEKGRPRGGERLPGKLRRALERGLSLDPRERFPTMRGLVEVIGRRRGPSVPIVVALVGASLGAGLLAYPVLFDPAPPAEACGLRRAVDEVRDAEAWDGVRARLAEAGVAAGLERLDQHLQRLEAQAQALCDRTGEGEEARRQHLQAWVEDLGGFLATAQGRSIGDLVADIEELEHARLTAPPPRALDQRVVAASAEAQALVRRNDLEAALAAADRAVKLAGRRSLELAIAQQRRGHVLTLLGRHREAIDAHRVAVAEAEASSYDDARLDAWRRTASTVIRRLEQLERGRDALEEVRGLLERLDEPWPSPRRAFYHELRAALLMRQGQATSALAEQWLAILQGTLLGRVYDSGLAYTNLGTIYERRMQSPEHDRHDLQRARASYEHALALLEPMRPSPSWSAAANNLGHFLAIYGAPEEWDRAESLLDAVREHDDLRVDATRDLIVIHLRRDEVPEACALAKPLVPVLVREPPRSPSHAVGVWGAVAMAFAAAGDWPAFDDAFAAARRAAEEVSASDDAFAAAEVVEDVGAIELTVGPWLAEVDRERGVAMVRSARERLATLPATKQITAMLAAADAFLAGH